MFECVVQTAKRWIERLTCGEFVEEDHEGIHVLWMLHDLVEGAGDAQAHILSVKRKEMVRIAKTMLGLAWLSVPSSNSQLSTMGYKRDRL